MKKVIDTEKLPIKLWLDDIESGAKGMARPVPKSHRKTLRNRPEHRLTRKVCQLQSQPAYIYETLCEAQVK